MTKTNIIYASKDTFISNDLNGSKVFNFGKHQDLILNRDSKILIYFDLSSLPENATITSAKLHLYLYSTNSITNVTIKQLDNDFCEYTVTSDTSPTSSPLFFGDANIKSIYKENINEFVTFANLTNTVSYWYSNSSTNHGFELSTPIARISPDLPIYRSITDYVDYNINFLSREYVFDNLKPNLEVEYTTSTPPIITTTTSEKISLTTEFTLTNVYNISNAISFNYFINNSNKESDFINATIQTCNTPQGFFENLGTVIRIPAGINTSFEVPPINKYIRLSITGSPDTTVNVQGVLKSFTTPLTSTLGSAQIIGDRIILAMTKPLTGTTASHDSFTITSSNRGQNIKIVKALVSDTCVTLQCSDTRIFLPDNTSYFINYIKPITNYLTGVDGDVDSFTSKLLTPATPYINLPEEQFALSTSDFITTIYPISNILSFKYIIRFQNKNTSISVQPEYCDSRTGTFSPIGAPLSIKNIRAFIFPISLENKYIRLLIKGDPSNEMSTVSVTPTFSSYANNLPCEVSSCEIIDDGTKINVKMSAHIFGSTAHIQAFTINPPLPNTTITSATISYSSIVLILSQPILPAPEIPLHLTYKGTGTNDLIYNYNEEVNNFTNYPIEFR